MTSNGTFDANDQQMDAPLVRPFALLKAITLIVDDKFNTLYCFSITEIPLIIHQSK